MSSHTLFVLSSSSLFIPCSLLSLSISGFLASQSTKRDVAVRCQRRSYSNATTSLRVDSSLIAVGHIGECDCRDGTAYGLAIDMHECVEWQSDRRSQMQEDDCTAVWRAGEMEGDGGKEGRLRRDEYSNLASSLQIICWMWIG